MGKILTLLVVLFSLLTVAPVHGATPYQSDEELQADARRGLEQILDLWHDGRYGELFDRTAASGKSSREQFVKKLAAASRKPSCCWEKMQEVKVSIKSDNSVFVRAKLGFDGGLGGTEYVTKSLKLQKESGVWCVSQADIYSLAGVSKKKVSHRKKTAQAQNQ